MDNEPNPSSGPMPRRVLSVTCFPVVFGGALWGTHAALSRAVAPSVVVLAITIAVALCVTVLERALPFCSRWRDSHDDVPTDAVYAVSSIVAAPRLFDTLAAAALVQVSVWLTSHVDVQLWPGGWPWLPQVVLAVVVAELGSYGWHRAMHETSLLFRLHATHHSAPRLYWLNATRFHPLDNVVMYGVQVLPLIVLGAPATILVGFTVWSLAHGFFQHANVDVRLGPLNYFFSMAELHRWHHSRHLEEANKNYGSNCIVWDLVFGTFFWPRDRRPPADIGLHGLPGFPQRFLPQMLSPFVWDPEGWARSSNHEGDDAT